MDLWIRSQDRKKLLKIEDIYLNNDSLNNHYIKTFKDNEEVYLGTYKKEERALEVLDEIQMKLGINEKYFMDELPDNEFVYQMPQD